LTNVAENDDSKIQRIVRDEMIKEDKDSDDDKITILRKEGDC